jgi:hypothetical protein
MGGLCTYGSGVNGDTVILIVDGGVLCAMY